MSNEEQVKRAPRVFAHAIATIKANNWNPLGGWSAIVLDLSAGGCKLELVEGNKFKEGKKYYLDIPLASFNVSEPNSLKLYGEVMWYNDKRLRIGFRFIEPKREQVDIINHILDNLDKSS